MTSGFPIRHQVGHAFRHAPKEAERILIEALEASSGVVWAAADQLGVSVPHFYYLLGQLGLRPEPARIRARRASRFRLPPLEGGRSCT